jgi:hypothetical protein
VNDMLTYPEQRSSGSVPGGLFDGAFAFLNRVGLDIALDLLTCFLEAL